MSELAEEKPDLPPPSPDRGSTSDDAVSESLGADPRDDLRHIPPEVETTSKATAENWAPGDRINDLLPEEDRRDLGMQSPLGETDRAPGELDGPKPDQPDPFRAAAPPDWPEIPDRDLKEGFTGEVRPVEIDPSQTDLFRHVGDNSRIDGNWWSRDEVPDTRDAAQGGLAVKGDWNGMSDVVHLDDSEPIRGWAGVGTAQEGANGHLPGGDEQVYIPDSELPKIREGEVSITPAPWNRPS